MRNSKARRLFLRNSLWASFAALAFLSLVVAVWGDSPFAKLRSEQTGILADFMENQKK
jgi:hypothetical protein